MDRRCHPDWWDARGTRLTISVRASALDAGNVARNAHPDRTITSQVQELKGLKSVDIRVAAIIQFALRNLHLPDDSVTDIAHDRFQKTDFQRRPKIEDAKAAVRDPSTRIAEPRWAFPNPSGFGNAFR